MDIPVAQRVSPHVKLLACLASLVLISSLPWTVWIAAEVAICALAIHPKSLLRGTVVLPFAGFFALLIWWGGDARRAEVLLSRSYLSAVCVSLLLATTPFHKIMEAARRLGAPDALVQVTQFTWRYLHVIVEQGKRMQTAAALRGGSGSARLAVFRIGSLFVSSYARAERIHRAMLSRGVS